MSAFEKGPGRISASGDGLGEVSSERIAGRAAEIARNEGRERSNGHDLARAEAELSSPGVAPSAPEIAAPELENMTAWDEAPVADGRAPRAAIEDEANIAEQLVQEGVEEAEHDRRARAGELPDDV